MRSRRTEGQGRQEIFPDHLKAAQIGLIKDIENLILRGCRAPAARVLSGSLIFPLKPEGTKVQIICKSEVSRSTKNGFHTVSGKNFLKISL